MLNYTNGTISKVQIVGNYRKNDLYLPQIARERKIQRKLMGPKKSKTSSMPLPLHEHPEGNRRQSCPVRG